MQNDGIVMEACRLQLFCDGCQSVKVQLCLALEFISTMACADGNGKGIHTRAFYEINCLIGISVGCMCRIYVNLILNACQLAQLCLNHDASFVGVFYDFLCLCYVFLILQMGTVKHDRCETVFDTVFTYFKIRAVIQMQCNIQIGFFDCGIHHCLQIFGMRIFQSRFGNLQDDSGILRLCRSYDTLDDFHVIDVECTDGIAALKCLFKHFFCCYHSHIKTPLLNYFGFAFSIALY